MPMTAGRKVPDTSRQLVRRRKTREHLLRSRSDSDHNAGDVKEWDLRSRTRQQVHVGKRRESGYGRDYSGDREEVGSLVDRWAGR
jgi:hypothetical protein